VAFKPRPKQREVLAYRSGKMGVSAVPGSGKTQTLSYLAAEIISSGVLDDDQEVLVVTLVNSAVDNFRVRIGLMIEEKGMFPNLGFRVRTLHGLAHDIVRERPGLVGLESNFQIVDERAADQIREQAAGAWLRAHPFDLDEYLDPEMEEGKRDWVRREHLPELVKGIANAYIRQAKDLQITPDLLQEKLSGLPVPLPLAEMGAAIYADYQRALAYRGAVDFDDLIRLALLALRSDHDYLERLRLRWPYILEDEAQDSSRLQEEILKLLAGDGNWVRVGDPNQAIYETFTTASPQFLKDFIDRPDVLKRQLPNSGRSSRSIIKLANRLIEWTIKEHPLAHARQALSTPYIKPTPRGDPQPNPPDQHNAIQLRLNKFTPQEELAAVANSLARWLPEHPDQTAAVLVPRNTRGFELVNELKRREIEYVEILASTSTTRAAAGALGNVLNYIADPQSAKKLAKVYEVWRRADRDDDQAWKRAGQIASLLRKCPRVEDFVWPRPERDWLDEQGLAGEDQAAYDSLLEFRTLVQRWLGTALLPVDQAVLTLAQDLFSEPTDLAISHKLALILRQASQANPTWRLPELTEELAVVARNERRFLGFGAEDTGLDPDIHKGKVMVATVHKAKGLEWDRVYLMSVNNYDFPSGSEYDSYLPERWFLRRNLNLEAEALDQLKAALSTDEYSWYSEGSATEQARLEYISERLRLLFVGITRARKELILTWNTGRQGNMRPAETLLELAGFLDRQSPKTDGSDAQQQDA
jgi:DNA helicase II / ATP-dependent DNA helicase PcrA